MKIDNETLTVLKHFAKINQGILILEGNVVKTVSPLKTVLAKAVVKTNFEKRFAIYNLDQFLSVVSLFRGEPEFIFKDEHVVITDGVLRTAKYYYASEETIKVAPSKDIVMPSVDVSLKLTIDEIKEIERAMGILSVEQFVLEGKNGQLLIRAADLKTPGSNDFAIRVADTDKEFSAIFKSSNFNLIPGDYQVEISSKLISHFIGENVEYWIAVELGSEFN